MTNSRETSHVTVILSIGPRRLACAALLASTALGLSACGTLHAGATATQSPAPTDSISSIPTDSSSPSPSISQSTTYPIDELTAIAQQYATMFGGSSLTLVDGVYTKRAAAIILATPGDDVGQDRDAPVFVIQEQGQFTGGNMEPAPAGATQVSGTQLMLVVNAQTLKVSDLGISTNSSDMSSLGSVFTIPATG